MYICMCWVCTQTNTYIYNIPYLDVMSMFAQQTYILLLTLLLLLQLIYMINILTIIIKLNANNLHNSYDG